MAKSLLELDSVTIASTMDVDSILLYDVRCELNAGDFILININPDYGKIPLAEVIQGLQPPIKGRVIFQGKDWSSIDYDKKCQLRTDFGRVFETESWIQHLTIEENILLQQIHYTKGSLGSYRTKILELVRYFGLPGLPEGYPNEYREKDLFRASLIRACISNPKVFLIEDAGFIKNPELVRPFLNILNRSLSSGSAVIWVTDDFERFNQDAFPVTKRLDMVGGKLVERSSCLQS